jgi:hypothetical protein
MKALIGSLAGVALLATPALAQTTNAMSSSGAKATTKTMVTKGAKSTATTTVTTKVTPNKGKSKMTKHRAKKKMKGVPKKKMTTTTTTTPKG